MHLSTLSEWLSWIASLHLTEMELGLARVKAVGARLDLLSPKSVVILVGGTNGKGSTVAGLESIYLRAGYHVGAFTSPYLFKPNEEVRVNGKDALDEDLCLAFEKIAAARGEISLTPFEFFTLAALWIFKQHSLDVIILEVGLGGRLDAVNMVEPDVAIVTSIDIDHAEWLGSTREAIGFEKAGIFRAHKPAICGDPHPPKSLAANAALLGAHFYSQGQDFSYQEENEVWHFLSHTEIYKNLPNNYLFTQNMATVLMAVTLLQKRLPVTEEAIKKGLLSIQLIGRQQYVEGTPSYLLDVAHNPAATIFLAKALSRFKKTGKVYAVFSMLADKDIVQSISAIKPEIDKWFVAPLTVKRAASKEVLVNSFSAAYINNVEFFPDLTTAEAAARDVAKKEDMIVIFGSFHTVATVYPVILK